jgi:hypothetical protein
LGCIRSPSLSRCRGPRWVRTDEESEERPSARRSTSFAPAPSSDSTNSYSEMARLTMSVVDSFVRSFRVSRSSDALNPVRSSPGGRALSGCSPARMSNVSVPDLPAFAAPCAGTAGKPNSLPKRRPGNYVSVNTLAARSSSWALAGDASNSILCAFNTV